MTLWNDIREGERTVTPHLASSECVVVVAAGGGSGWATLCCDLGTAVALVFTVVTPRCVELRGGVVTAGLGS